jgi:hypothetical protein
MSPDTSTDASDFYRLRERFFSLTRSELSCPAVNDSAAPWGVIMEIGYATAIVTVSAFSSGEVNVLRSCGGHYLHAESRESVRRAGVFFLQRATLLQTSMAEANTFLLPNSDEVFFWFRTDYGIYSATMSASELSSRRDDVSRLYYAGLAILHEVQFAIL